MIMGLLNAYPTLSGLKDGKPHKYPSEAILDRAVQTILDDPTPAGWEASLSAVCDDLDRIGTTERAGGRDTEVWLKVTNRMSEIIRSGVLNIVNANAPERRSFIGLTVECKSCFEGHKDYTFSATLPKASQNLPASVKRSLLVGIIRSKIVIKSRRAYPADKPVVKEWLDKMVDGELLGLTIFTYPDRPLESRFYWVTPIPDPEEEAIRAELTPSISDGWL
jgi:hypothetical protein